MLPSVSGKTDKDMKGTIVVEQGRDGYFSCHMEEEIPYVGLFGFGSSSQEAIDDLKAFYSESKEDLAKEGKNLPEIEFTIAGEMLAATF